ncbi:MAG: HDOD domain-containing protein [Nitrospirota bacterium]
MGDILKTYVQRIKELPTLPAIAHKILVLANDPLLSIDDLLDIVETDPAISAKILSVSNSAFFGYPVRTTKLNDAIMRIGMNNVKSIAVGIAVLSFLGDGKKTKEYTKLYHHSVCVGLTSQFIARNLRLNFADDVLIDGLLHDLGYLALYKYFPEVYSEIMKSVKNGRPLLEAEKEILSYSHSDVGFWLADQWNLPSSVVDTVLYHHMPSLAKKNSKRSAIVHIADYISALKIPFSPIEITPDYPLDHYAFDILSISDDDLKEMEASIEDIPFSDEILSLSQC